MPNLSVLREKIDAAITRLRPLGHDVNPLDLLSRVAFHHLLKQDGMEADHAQREAQVCDQMNRDVGWCQGRLNTVVLPSRRFVYFGRDRANHSAGIWQDFPTIGRAAEPSQQFHLVHHKPELKRELLNFCESILRRKWPNGPETDEPHHRPSGTVCDDSSRCVC